MLLLGKEYIETCQLNLNISLPHFQAAGGTLGSILHAFMASFIFLAKNKQKNGLQSSTAPVEIYIQSKVPGERLVILPTCSFQAAL